MSISRSTDRGGYLDRERESSRTMMISLSATLSLPGPSESILDLDTVLSRSLLTSRRSGSRDELSCLACSRASALHLLLVALYVLYHASRYVSVTFLRRIRSAAGNAGGNLVGSVSSTCICNRRLST